MRFGLVKKACTTWHDIHSCIVASIYGHKCRSKLFHAVYCQSILSQAQAKTWGLFNFHILFCGVCFMKRNLVSSSSSAFYARFWRSCLWIRFVKSFLVLCFARGYISMHMLLNHIWSSQVPILSSLEAGADPAFHVTLSCHSKSLTKN